MSGVSRLFRHKVTSIGCGTLLSLAQWLASTYQYRKDTFFKTCSFKEYFISKPLKDHYHNHQSSCAGWQWGDSSCQRTTQGQALKNGLWGDSSIPDSKAQPITLISWHSSVSALFQVMYRLAVRRLIMSKNYTSEVWKRGPWGDSSVPSPKSSPTTRNSFCFYLKE